MGDSNPITNFQLLNQNFLLDNADFSNKLLEIASSTPELSKFFDHLNSKYKEICIKGSTPVISILQNRAKQEREASSSKILELDGQIEKFLQIEETLKKEKQTLEGEKHSLTEKLQNIQNNEASLIETKDKFSEMEKQYNELKSKYTSQVESLELSSKENQSQITKLMDENGELDKKIIESEKRSTSLQFEISSLESKITSLNSVLNQEKSKHSQVVQELTTKLTQLEESNDLKSRELQKLKEKHTNQQANLATTQPTITQLEQSIKEKQGIISDLKSEKENLNSIINKQAESYQEHKKAQQSILDNLTRSNQAQADQIEGLNNQIKSLEAQLSEKDKILEQSRQKIDTLSYQLSQVHSETELNQNHQSLLPSMTSLITIHQTLKTNGWDISQIQSELSSLKNSNQALVNQKNSLIELFNQSLDDLQSFGPEYRDRLQGFEGLYDKYLSTCKELKHQKDQNSDFKVSLNSLHSQLQESQQLNISLSNKLGILTQLSIQLASFQTLENFDLDQYLTPEDLDRLSNLKISSHLNFTSINEFVNIFVDIASLLENEKLKWDQREKEISSFIRQIDTSVDGSLDQILHNLKSKVTQERSKFKILQNELENLKSYQSHEIKLDAKSNVDNSISESKYSKLVHDFETLQKSSQVEKNNLSQSIIKLKEENITLQGDIRALRVKTNDFQSHNNALTSKIKTMEDKIFCFKSETSGLVNGLQSFDLEKYNLNLSNISKQLSDTKDKLSKTSNELIEYKAKCIKAEQDYNLAKDSLEKEQEVNQALRNYKSKFEEFSKLIQDRNQDIINSLKSEKISLEDRVKTLNNDLIQNQKGFQTNLEQLQQTNDDLTREINDLKLALHTSESKFNSSQVQIEELQRLKTTLDSRIESLILSKEPQTPSQHRKHVDNLKTQIESLTTQLEQAKLDIQAQEKIAISHQTLLESVQSDLNEKLQEKESFISAKDKEIIHLQSEVERLQKELDSEFTKSEQWRSKAEDSQTQIDDLSKSRNDALAEVEIISKDYESKISSLKSQISTLNIELQNASIQRDQEHSNQLDLFKKITDTQQERNNLKMELEGVQNELTDALKKVNDYKSELVSTKEDLESTILSLQTRVIELDSQNDTLLRQFTNASRTQVATDQSSQHNVNLQLALQIDHLKTQISVYHLQITELKSDLEIKDKQLFNTQSDLESEKQKILSIQPSSTLIEQMETLKKDLASTNIELSQSKIQIEKKEESYNELKNERDSLKTRLFQSEQNIITANSQIKTLEQKVRIADHEAKNWMDRFQAASQSNNSIDPDEFANLQQEIETVKTEKTQLIRNFKLHLGKQKERMDLMQSKINQFEEYKRNHPHTSEEYQTLKSAQDQLQIDLQNEKKSLENLQAEKTKLGEQKNLFAQMLKQAQKLRNENEAQLKVLQEEKAKNEAELKDLKDKLHKAELRLKLLQNQRASPKNAQSNSLNPTAPTFTPKVQLPNSQQSTPKPQNTNHITTEHALPISSSTTTSTSVPIKSEGNTTIPVPAPIDNNLGPINPVAIVPNPLNQDASENIEINEGSTQPPAAIVQSSNGAITNSSTIQPDPVEISATVDSKPNQIQSVSLPCSDNVIVPGEPENPPQPSWLKPQHSTILQSFSPTVTPTPGAKRNFEQVENEQTINELNLPSPQAFVEGSAEDSSLSPKKSKTDLIEPNNTQDGEIQPEESNLIDAAPAPPISTSIPTEAEISSITDNVNLEIQGTGNDPDNSTSN